MKECLRRVAAIVLTIVMVIGMLPMAGRRAKAAEKEDASDEAVYRIDEGPVSIVDNTVNGEPVDEGKTIVIEGDTDIPTTNTITIEASYGNTVTVVFRNVNIDVSDIPDTAAVRTKGKGNTTIRLVGKSAVKSGENCAGVQKEKDSGRLSVTATDATNSLEATGGKEGAGIGGGAAYGGSNITISGGKVIAKGGEAGSGIGGGFGGAGTDIIIEGDAVVTADGGMNGAGIGGGGLYGGAHDIFIRGGANVTARGGEHGAGIGSTQSPSVIFGPGSGEIYSNAYNIYIEGESIVTAFGGSWAAGIGGGYLGKGGLDNSPIVISGSATVTATGGEGGAGIGGGSMNTGIGFGGVANGHNISIKGEADVTATGGKDGAGIGGGELGGGSDISITGEATVTATGGENGAGVGGGFMGGGSDISITGTASVTAKSGENGAGIGGGFMGSANNITIEGETDFQINAIGDAGAGIGGGCIGAGTGIHISVKDGASVNATSAGGAGIGDGGWGGADDISIKADSGATVNAIGKEGGTGIGCGFLSEAGRITIEAKEGAFITAAGSVTGNGIGGSGATITISGEPGAIVIARIVEDISTNEFLDSFTQHVEMAGEIRSAILGKEITIKGGGTVIATGEIPGGAGIGDGVSIDDLKIHIQDSSVVSVAGGISSDSIGEGAGIGSAGNKDEDNNPLDGEEVGLSKIIDSPFNGDIRYYEAGTTAEQILKLEAENARRNCYSVIYDANDGSGRQEIQKITIGIETPLKLYKFVLEGHTIEGWNDNKEGNGNSYTDGQRIRLSANLTLYTQWSAHVFDQMNPDEQYVKYEATCTDRAVYYKSCKCGLQSSDENDTFISGEVIAHDYSPIDGSAIAPTCTKAGKEADQKCSRCNHEVAGKEIAATGHTFDQEVVEEKYLKSAADCINAAVYFKSCKCGEKSSDEKDVFTSGKELGHDYKTVDGSAVAPTCTKAGKEADLKCSRCKAVITGKEIAATGHTFDQEVVDEKYLKSAADCTNAAVYYKSCKCGEKSTDEKDVFSYGEELGHDYKVVEGSAVASTCTKAGKEADQKCSRCDAVITGKEIAATGHTFDQEVVDEKYLKSAADCITAAVYYKSCKCGEKSTDEKDVFTSGKELGHDYKVVDGSAVEPTDTKDGKEADQKCSRCGDVIEGKVLHAKGHTFDQVVADAKYLKSAADCITAAVYYKSCKCGEKSTDEKDIFTYGEPAGHKWKAATGYAPKTCEVCGLEEGQKVTYDPITGQVFIWTKGSKEPFVLTIKRSQDDVNCFLHYLNTLLDGVEIKVESRSGSTIITIPAETLELLTVGDHLITVMFDDWKADFTLTIAAPVDASPATGDENHVFAFAVMMLAAVAMGVVVWKKRRSAA